MLGKFLSKSLTETEHPSLLDLFTVVIENELMRFVDLFCGIGGFHAALHRLGHECVFATDIDKAAAETYELNWG